MPTIEVLPNLNPSHAAPGWAYVPETAAPDPSRALQPKVPGRRTAAKSAIDALTGAHTKTQAAKVRSRLDELAKDNPGRAEVDVPNALGKDIAAGAWKGKGTVMAKNVADRKQSTNVKRLLISSKTWAHHAADEEVRIQNAVENQRSKKDVVMIDAPEKPSQQSEFGTLLDTKNPAFPSQQVIDTLVRGPPLSYRATAAGPPLSFAPARKFCAMCGYWGKNKCTVCGTYVCGLSCKVTHDATEHPHR